MSVLHIGRASHAATTDRGMWRSSASWWNSCGGKMRRSRLNSICSRVARRISSVSGFMLRIVAFEANLRFRRRDENLLSRDSAAQDV